ncbi:hypothetical protein SAMN02949497_3037 [Methylomagnum ishizawai]|uniref:Addiction module component n=1 Tax=Methylomagnum ishizawai TaxID=1760988 RepID=A0A1Y6D711_9GAMM|nr:hypothetical protein [Methylomagnum ishizawai]SMF95665.1 hypothetical protein SAMN02949497_3037 [Methylomagnum ishizawai]
MSPHYQALGIDRLSLAEQIALARTILDRLAVHHADTAPEPAASSAPEPSPEDLQLWEAIQAKALAQLHR